MVRTLKVLAFVFAVACFWSSPASAQQCPFSLPYGHAGIGFLDACNDEGRLSGFAYGIGTTANSGSTNIMCGFDGQPTQGSPEGCIGGGGPGDGIATIAGNWGNVGVTGCPNPSGVPGAGRNVYVVRDSSGGGIIISVGYSVDFGAYVAEAAHKADTGLLSCKGGDNQASSRAVMVRSINKTGDATTTDVVIDASAIPPVVFSDCDPDSQGPFLNTCTEGTLPPVGAGRLLSRVGDCSGADLADLRLAAWTPFTGSASFPSSLCLFLGATAMIGGTETPAVVGAVSVQGNASLAPSPRALAVRARQSGGDVIVDFNTSTEVGLLGLEIVTGKGRLIASVPLRGIGGEGAVYSEPTKRGAYRSEHELYVVAITASGRVNSDPARF